MDLAIINKVFYKRLDIDSHLKFEWTFTTDYNIPVLRIGCRAKCVLSRMFQCNFGVSKKADTHFNSRNITGKDASFLVKRNAVA